MAFYADLRCFNLLNAGNLAAFIHAECRLSISTHKVYVAVNGRINELEVLGSDVKITSEGSVLNRTIDAVDCHFRRG